jgi:hypothetical protein
VLFQSFIELTFLEDARFVAVAAGFLERASAATGAFFAGFEAALAGLDFSTALGFLAVFGLAGAGAAFWNSEHLRGAIHIRTLKRTSLPASERALGANFTLPDGPGLTTLNGRAHVSATHQQTFG